MLVEHRRSALPLDLIPRVALVWLLVSCVLIAVNWYSVSALFAAIGIPVLNAVALIAVPLLTLGCTMLLAARIAWRLMGDEEATLAALIPALSIPLLFEVSPIRIDSHGWQIICALVAMNALMARRPEVGGRIIGATCAVWLAISVEGLVFTVAMFSVLAMRWLNARQARGWLIGAVQTLAVVSLAALLIKAGLFASPILGEAWETAFVAAACWGATALSLFGRFEPLPLGARCAGFATVVAGASGIIAYLAPPLMFDGWMPIWQQGFAAVVLLAITPLIGLVTAMHLASTSRDWLNRYWSDYAIIALVIALFAMAFTPAIGIACALAAPPMAWQVHRWMRRIRVIEPLGPRLAATLCLACALLPALPMIVIASAVAL